MKKLLLLLALLSCAFAAENGSYIGVGTGYSMLKVDYPQNAKNENSDGMLGTFALGYKYNAHSRIYAEGMFRDSSNGYPTAGSISLAYDFLVPMDNILSLYVGPVAGYTNYNSNDIGEGSAHYGVEIGAVFTLNKTVELEAGYRLLKESVSNTTANTTYSASRSQALMVQFNFYFESEKYFKYDN